MDAPKDRLHPIKRNRAIASGKISAKQAQIIIFILLGGSVLGGYFFVGTYFTLAVIFYIAIQVAYSIKIRNIIILEALFVAGGFIIRVFAGGFAAESSVSSWLILTTTGLSLLLAFGKRRSEKTILLKHLDTKDQIKTRDTLRHYPDNLLNSMISMSSTFCIITYALFAFQISPETNDAAITKVLPSIISSPKWMMLTIPIVIYGVARYLYVIYEKEEGESPARVLMSDKPLFASVITWGVATLFVIYLLPSILIYFSTL